MTDLMEKAPTKFSLEQAVSVRVTNGGSDVDLRRFSISSGSGEVL